MIYYNPSKLKTSKYYNNGQKVNEQKGSTLTWFYKAGNVWAKGKSVNSFMEGKWVFYHKSGELGQIGHFKKNKKHGEWVRYDKNGKVVYHAIFADGKLVSKKEINRR